MRKHMTMAKMVRKSSGWESVWETLEEKRFDDLLRVLSYQKRLPLKLVKIGRDLSVSKREMCLTLYNLFVVPSIHTRHGIWTTKKKPSTFSDEFTIFDFVTSSILIRSIITITPTHFFEIANGSEWDGKKSLRYWQLRHFTQSKHE